MAATPERVTRAAKPAWRQQAEAFWRWWTAQLAREVPASLGGVGTKRAPVVALRAETLYLLEARGNAITEIGQAPLASLDLEGRRIALRSLLERAGETEPRMRLCLDREESLVRRISLPLATEENLPQVLAFEMDRLTPFRAEEVYFDHRVAARDAAAGKIQVDLAVARRDVVESKVARLREFGADVQGVVLADDVARWNSALNLMPEGQPGDRDQKSRERNLQVLAGGGVAFLLAIALVLPVWQKREAVISMQPLLTKAREEAGATDALSRELDKIVADYNFLLAKKHATQPALVLVEELTRLMPDTTWVQQLDIRPVGKVREVQISGETPSSSKLIEIFEQSQILQNAAPRGSVTRGSQPGTERFLIAAEVRPRTLPESIPVSVVASFPPQANVPVAPPAAAPAPGPASAPASAPAPATAAAPASAPSAAAPVVPPPTATVTPAPAKPAATVASPPPAQSSPPAPSSAPADFGPAPRPAKKAAPPADPGK